MKIKFIATGATTEKFLTKGMEQYLERIKAMVKIEYIELSAGKASKKANPELVKKEEAQLQLKHIESNAHLILLDERGEMFTSVDFAQFLQNQFNTSGQNLIFLMGGAYGFNSMVYERANRRISLSLMTFTHQMVRLVFMEQFYRAITILKGMPYHHN